MFRRDFLVSLTGLFAGLVVKKNKPDRAALDVKQDVTAGVLTDPRHIEVYTVHYNKGDNIKVGDYLYLTKDGKLTNRYTPVKNGAYPVIGVCMGLPKDMPGYLFYKRYT
jgi:hypothetical protein